LASSLAALASLLVRLRSGDAALGESAATSLEQRISTIHATTARPGRDPRFPQDRRESSPPLAGGARPVGLDAAWLSYESEAVLRPYLGAAARALGLIARAAEEADALWRKVPDGGAMSAPPYLITAVIADRHGLDPALRLGWGSWLCPTPDEITLRRALGAPEILRALRSQLAIWVAEVRPLSATEEERERVEGFLADIHERWERALSTSWVWRHMPGGWDAPRISIERARTIRLARAGLLADDRLREAWEVQRWGAWCETPRVARFFPAGLCLLALAEAGADVREAAGELLSSEASPDGYRYYGRWIGIPPDADDLGLALDLLPIAGDTPERRRALTHPIEVLVQSTEPDGWINTYLEQGLIEPTPPDSPHWLVRRCSAVVMRALIGLFRTEWPLPEGFRDRALSRLIEVLHDEGLASVDAYPACYARLLLARLGCAIEGRSCPAAARNALEEMLGAIEREIVATQELDGGWGSPLATACHLSVLALRRTPGFAPAAATLYLCARQEPDGLWPREALYHCPGRDGAQHDYATRSVTTAICLSALALTDRAWPG
jgi:hypothetical protein